MTPVYSIKDLRVAERPVRLRLPFRFGDTLVTETAEAYLQVTIEGPGGVASGIAAQLMVPRWFDKRPGLSNDDTVNSLRLSISSAVREALGQTGSVAQLAAAIRRGVVHSLSDNPRLAAGFGPALLEMALIDAACRDQALSFPEAARADLFGLAELAPPDLPADALKRSLAAIAPNWSINLRHTVGYDAPLTDDQVDAADRDGLPVSLDAVIAATGVSCFKIKLKGDPMSDIARLKDIAAIIAPLGGYRATLDANEQYQPDAFDAFLAQFMAEPALSRLVAATAFVEQPFARETALAEDGPIPPKTMPLVIDESDDDDDSFPCALARGWSGVSVKSCKGVLRALLNAARVAEARTARRGAILTAEDLTCQPGLCWQQDTLMAATLGVRDIERNGHHFAGGMQGASEAEKTAFLNAHPDIYVPGPKGPTLRIEGGQVRIASLDAPGFGSLPRPELTDKQTLEEREDAR
ncbi:mandelate racemase [Pelagibius litoralis]|uniref:Mandelate racemase n=1 Tax=Pelagibius litoralis TaxID=374515 RepID=A0A967F378_9PROT|nr:mandelate racemase [Pelagibius litoralis]NIA72260.1 mandelate racemase [Pelagibius litoralis]